jgi:hypothetical protein
MNVFRYFLLLLFLATGIAADGQTGPASSKIIVLGDTFCVSRKTPIAYTYGSLIRIDCDTVYVINKARFGLYEKARKTVINNNYSNAQRELAENYEQALAEQDKAFRELFDRYQRLDSSYQLTITTTRSSILAVNENLNAARQTVDAANKNLAEVNKIIAAARRRNFLDKVLYGMGGVGIGVIAGVLLVR